MPFQCRPVDRQHSALVSEVLGDSVADAASCGWPCVRHCDNLHFGHAGRSAGVSVLAGFSDKLCSEKAFSGTHRRH